MQFKSNSSLVIEKLQLKVVKIKEYPSISMEKLQSQKIHTLQFRLLLLLSIFHFSFLQILPSAYTPPDIYFINCGTRANVSVSNRMFVGDLKFFTGPSKAVRDSHQSPDTPYQTARIFSKKSSYQFDINDNGTYVVRLHFFTFPSRIEFSRASFDVLASGFTLLRNFTGESSWNSPLINEFFLSIDSGKFTICFVPKESSIAFVNAIEVFLAPPSFIYDVAPLFSPKGGHGDYKGILSQGLRTIHRINVGGVTPADDTLWRHWVPDDMYLYNATLAKNTSVAEKPNYQGNTTQYIAPDFVYQTAKVIDMDSNTSIFPNLTWCFNVSKNGRHLVRVHFGDFVSKSQNVLKFNLYFYGKLAKLIYPYDIILFFFDFVVESDSSGLLNISIGPRGDSLQHAAFLNGVEIMETVEKSGSVCRADVQSQHKNHVFVVVGSVLGGLALICMFLVVFFWRLRCRKPMPVETSVWSPVPAYGAEGSHSRGTEKSIPGSSVPNLNLGLKITFAEIRLATNKFDKKLLIGMGGFGNVYRGTLKNGTKVAVKRSEPGSGQGRPEFQTEIVVLSKIRHRHLVSLIGYCDERSEMILVYEFMEKGSLRDHLYDSDLPCLSWKQRLEICVGAARGLHYLHTGSVGGIIHRDVKSTNILLDANYVAKVADFGLSKSGPPDQTYVSTDIKGSFGYLDPEYFRTQQLTDKSDVYSFGVVLLEVLCARTAINPLLPREQVNLADWGMSCKKEGLLEKIVDPLITGQINPNSLRKFGETAEKCLQEDGAGRPTMGEVLWDLEYALQLQKTVMQREPHEDSRTDASSVLMLSNVRRFPSISLTTDTDDTRTTCEDGVESTASEVFSQLRIDDAR